MEGGSGVCSYERTVCRAGFKFGDVDGNFVFTPGCEVGFALEEN